VPAIEVTTHTVLRDLLRHQPEIVEWNHYLTMARLVARALRLSKSALIQTGVATHRSQGKYRLSYAIAALLWDRSVVIVMPVEHQERFLTIELPQYQRWLGTNKPVYAGNLSPAADFNGLWITDPRSWLKWQLEYPALITDRPTIVDGADDLENWAQELLTVKIAPEDWNTLQVSQAGDRQQTIIDLKLCLLESLWQRPIDPYNCYVLDPKERSLVDAIRNFIDFDLSPTWQTFYQQLSLPTNRLVSATLDRARGTFTLSIAPINLVPDLAPIWERQPTVLITSAVDTTADAIGYRQELGLGEITSVKFSLVGAAANNGNNRYSDLFQLYIPRWMPMPNTSKFQPILVDEIQQLLHLIDGSPKFVVILVGDTPLQGQLAAVLAAEWGSRVRVERTDLNESNILVSGWEFWQAHQDKLPTPQLTIVTTLPIPSLEDPLVAAKVSFYKQQKQDWFRLYLLPTGLRILHRAIDPMRTSQGIVAIFDNRINQRSYGKQVIAALMPAARINYPDLSWLDR
jgi:ATP-dependent DNA helicase DinG